MSLEQRFLTGFRSADSGEPGLVLAADGTVVRVDADGARTSIAPQLAVMAQEGDDHSHTGDTDETVLFRVSIPGGTMGKNGKLQLEFLGVNKGDAAGDVTFRCYFGPAGVDSAGQQVGGDTVVTADAPYQRCLVEVANRRDPTDQGYTPNTPMNAPYAAFSTVFPCAVNTVEDTDLIITGQCASASGVVSAASISCVFVDPADSTKQHQHFLYDSLKDGMKSFHVSPTRDSSSLSKGDTVRISNNRKLHGPYTVSSVKSWNPSGSDPLKPYSPYEPVGEPFDPAPLLGAGAIGVIAVEIDNIAKNNSGYELNGVHIGNWPPKEPYYPCTVMADWVAGPASGALHVKATWIAMPGWSYLDYAQVDFTMGGYSHTFKPDNCGVDIGIFARENPGDVGMYGMQFEAIIYLKPVVGQNNVAKVAATSKGEWLTPYDPVVPKRATSSDTWVGSASNMFPLNQYAVKTSYPFDLVSPTANHPEPTGPSGPSLDPFTGGWYPLIFPYAIARKH